MKGIYQKKMHLKSRGKHPIALCNSECKKCTICAKKDTLAIIL